MESLRVGGLTFPCRAAGPEQGEGVLLLHGFPQFSLEWSAQIDALAAAGYRVVAPDQRGYAKTNRPAGAEAYGMDQLVGDVIGLLDALGWERAHLVGHDWGGMVAWHVAGGHSERLKTLSILATPHPKALAHALATSEEQQQKSAYMAFFRQEGTAEDGLLANDAELLRGLYQGIPETETYVARFRDRETLTAALNWYRASPSRDAENSGVVRTPTLYIWGDQDIALGREAAEATAQFVEAPYDFVVLEGVSHWTPETAADDVNRLLLAHLSRT